MKIWQRRIWILLVLLGGAGMTNAALRIATYNIALGEIRPGLDTVLQAICQETYQGYSQPLDILLLQEQDSVQSTTQAIVDIINRIMPSVNYRRSQTNGTGPGGTMAVVYNPQTVTLLDETALPPPTSGDRAVMRYHFQLAGYSTSDSHLYVYVAHLKATTNSDSRDRRAVQAAQIRADADALGNDVNIIYAGDFNIYTSSEPAYQNLVAEGSARAYDPTGLVDWQGSEYRRWHTQAPAMDPADASLVGGGMDDRFDFQMISDSLHDGSGLDWIEGSYRTFGNNATHAYNGNISSGNGASAVVLNALMTASDHCPVVLEYRHPARMSVSASDLPSRVIARGFQYQVQVTNTAPCQVGTQGAAGIDYSIQTNLTGTRQYASMPSEWTLATIGTLAGEPFAQYLINPIGFEMSGGGNISSTSDNFPFLYRILHADGSLELKVSNLQSDSPGANAGLMVRQSLEPGSPFGYLYLTRDFGLKWRSRMSPGSTAFVSNGPADLNSAWLRISRQGEQVLAAWSSDRQSWTEWQSMTLSGMTGPAYLGLAISSLHPTATAFASFDTEDAGGANSGTAYYAPPAAGPNIHTFLLGQGQTENRTFNIEIKSNDPTVQNNHWQTTCVYRYADFDDFDQDCDFDLDDVNLLLTHLGSINTLYDLDRSGLVDMTDLQILFETVLDRPLGDIDLDGTVDLSDFLILANFFMTPSTGWNHADLNGDHFVNISDLNIIAQNWMRFFP